MRTICDSEFKYDTKNTDLITSSIIAQVNSTNWYNQDINLPTDNISKGALNNQQVDWKRRELWRAETSLSLSRSLLEHNKRS